MLTFKFLLLLMFSLMTLSCTKKQDSKTSNEINLAIWGNYLSAEVQNQFTQETGIKVNVTNYSTNEELLAKIQMSGSLIDMAVPSDYMVDIMKKLNLLEPLDRAQIPNFKNISSKVLRQAFDPENLYSIPYSWTTTGIAVNRSLYKGEIRGWKDVFNNPALAGKFSLFDDYREVIGAALKMSGFSLNTTDSKELAQAEELLLKTKKNVKMFRSDTIDLLKNKEVIVAQAYLPDALQAQAQSKDEIEYILPTEGTTRSIDNMVLIRGAKHKENALKLINYLLRPENNLAFVKSVRSGAVLDQTKDSLPPDLKNNKALFPSEKDLSKLEALQDLGDANRLYESIWTKIKTN